MFSSLLRTCLAGLVLCLPLGSAAAAEVDEEALLRLLKLRLGTDQVAPPEETGVEGVYQTRFGNKFAYLIEGGRYVFIGDLVDLQEARNLTEVSRRELVVEELASFDESRRVIDPAKGEEKTVLSVFTDTSCGYCQRLHSEVKYLQEAGISVHYYPYPRGGIRGPGYGDLRKVWCAGDQLEAMNIAKGTESGTLAVQSGDCEAAASVDQGYVLGNRIGVNGTPALYSANGTLFNGYVPYQQLIPQLLGQ